MDRPQPLKAVYEFCGRDDELYWEILEELEVSIENLKDKIANGLTDLDSLKFIAHKMKSSFRILKDEDFKQLLDDYIGHVESNEGGVNKSIDPILSMSASYLEMLHEELKNKS